MRFYQSLDYVNNIHSLNVGNNINGNISSGSNSENNNSSSNIGSTVKTFTSNGNHQALTKSIDAKSLIHSQNETDNINFLSNYRNDSIRHNCVTIKALAQALNSTTTDDHTETDAVVGGNQNLGEGENFISNSNGNAVDECDDSSETNINHMITRGNLYKLNFGAAETELDLIERNLSGSVECLASSPDDSFMEDDGMTFCFVEIPTIFPSLNTIHLNISDDYLSTPSPSLNLSEPSYPRGIINPNYPGFQHLAHTLSEHFIDHHQFGNMSDSDVSEVESDIANDKQPDANDRVDENSNNNNNFDDDNGNTDRQIIESNSNKATCDNGNRNIISDDENLSKVEEILRTVFESNSCHLRTAIETLAEHESNMESYWFGTNYMETESDQLTSVNDNDFVDASSEIIACDLKTYLKRYDEVGVNLDAHSICKNCDKLTPEEPPPDVIQKSTSSDNGFDGHADKPDILQNVAMDRSDVNCMASLSPGQNEKDEPSSQWSITPVDIVGNFEQEVERELGLLINGYKNKNLNCSDGQTALEIDHAIVGRRNASEKVM